MSPLEKGDHPKLDTSNYLDQEGVQKHQSLLGSTQWATSLGRLDVDAAVMTLASFRDEPREGHLDRATRVVSYLVKFKHATIIIRIEEPDLSSVPITPCDWEESVCGEVMEIFSEDTPKQKGKHEVTLSCYNANLHHNVALGRFVNALLHE